MQYNMQSAPDSFYQDSVPAGMIGHMPRFYPSHMQMQTTVQNSNPFRSLSRLPEEMRFDLNRNSVHDRQFYQNKLPKYYAEPKLTNKSSHVMRNSINRSLYSPYPPPMPPPNYFKTSPLEQTGYNPDPMVGDYCVELLNRDKHYWTDEETGLMLELYEENREYFNDSKTKKTKIWSIIADMVNKRFSTCVNAEQCSQKFRNLKAEFLKVSDPTLVDGGAKKFGRHFQQMKRLLEDEEKRAVIRSCDDKPENFESGKLESVKVGNINSSPTPSPDVAAAIKTPHLPTSPKATPTAPKISPSPPPNANYTPHEQKQYKSKAEILLECLINSTLSDINKADCDITKKNEEAVAKAEKESVDGKQLTESEFVDVESVNEIQLQGISRGSNKRVQTNNSDHVNNNNSDRYQTELRSIFEDYFVSRDKAVENFESNEKRNIVCMNKCIEVFRSVVRENILK